MNCASGAEQAHVQRQAVFQGRFNDPKLLGV